MNSTCRCCLIFIYLARRRVERPSPYRLSSTARRAVSMLRLYASCISDCGDSFSRLRFLLIWIFLQYPLSALIARSAAQSELNPSKTTTSVPLFVRCSSWCQISLQNELEMPLFSLRSFCWMVRNWIILEENSEHATCPCFESTRIEGTSRNSVCGIRIFGATA